MSGPLHGGAPARVLPMIEEVERTGDPRRVVSGILDRHERLMGFGHRVYRAEDPRARVLRRMCRELKAPRYEAAEALEQAALIELRVDPEALTPRQSLSQIREQALARLATTEAEDAT